MTPGPTLQELITTVRSDAAQPRPARPARDGVENRCRAGRRRRRGARALRRPVPSQRPLVVGDQRRPRGHEAGRAQALLARARAHARTHDRTRDGRRCVRRWKTRGRSDTTTSAPSTSSWGSTSRAAASPRRSSARPASRGRGWRNGYFTWPRAARRSAPNRSRRSRPARPRRSRKRSKRHCHSATTTSAPSTSCSRCSRTRKRWRRSC